MKVVQNQKTEDTREYAKTLLYKANLKYLIISI